jgi:hypothetical protein
MTFSVEGYANGSGLETVFSKEEIAAERQSLLTEFPCINLENLKT